MKLVLSKNNGTCILYIEKKMLYFERKGNVRVLGCVL